MNKHIGPQMKSLVEYVRANPGCTSLEARRNAVTYARGWSNHYSDAVLQRTLRAGLLRREWPAGKNGMSLYATDAS